MLLRAKRHRESLIKEWISVLKYAQLEIEEHTVKGSTFPLIILNLVFKAENLVV